MTGTGTYRLMDVSDVLDNLGDRNHGLRPARIVQLSDGQSVPDRIFQAATGPTTFSTCTELIPASIQPIFDVNSYYRDLGFDWPYKGITRGMLREAYTRLGGQGNERLTYCLRQLLDKQLRPIYDAHPPGWPMDDMYTWRLIKEVAAQWASEQSAETGELITGQDFLRSLGFDRLVDDESEDEEEMPEAVQVFLANSWPYGYYLLHSRRYDDVTLSEWQSIIISACAHEGLSLQLALGYVGRTEQTWAIYNYNNDLVIFVNENQQPTNAIAQEIATELRTRKDPQPMSAPTTEESTTSTASAFRRGGAQAAERQQAEAAARKAARGSTDYLSSLLKKHNDTVIIRFVIDEPDWIEVMQHSFLKTKAAPADKPADANWPDKMGAVCRKTEREDGEPFYPECFICDHMKGSNGKRPARGLRMWAIAVIRKEVIGTPEMAAEGKIPTDRVGQRVGLTDDTVEVDEVKDGKVTGNKIKRKRYVIVNYALKNFFTQFVQFSKIYGTALDRDYMITRQGEETESTYQAVPMDIIQKPILDAEGAPTGEREPFDLRNPKYADAYSDHGIDLAKIVMDRMSDRFYERFFDSRVTVPWSSDDDDSSPAATSSSSSTAASSEPSTVTEPAPGPVSDKLKAMRDKLVEDNKGRTEGASSGATTMYDFS